MTIRVLPRLFLLFLIFIAACAAFPQASPPHVAAVSVATLTPFQPHYPDPTALPSGLWLSASVPEHLRDAALAAWQPLSTSKDAARVILDVADAGSTGPFSTWIYALVAAFPTPRDAVSQEELRAAWAGEGPVLIMTAATSAAMQTIFGSPPAPNIKLLPAADITPALWLDHSQWAIIPFESINQQLKVLELDGQSPVRKEFDPVRYTLKVNFVLQPALFVLPASNRDPQKLTTILMTGTTALVRAISYKMQINGPEYPARDIGDWLRGADILHISNEVSFTPDCPAPDPFDGHLRFCSAPDNIHLLDAIGADVIELTGNHVKDWGRDALLYTLDLYRQRGWAVFGGGSDLAAAQQPAILERNGQKFAFVGCNAPGPDFAWATTTDPGAAPCGDYAWMVDEIKSLKATGAVVIVALQHYEYYSPELRPNQLEDFRRMADAGADVVSGSQAHYSQAMEFYNGKFIHYGLGNLFFDQMGYSYADGTRTTNTRREFLDRYVFYEGRLINTELLTAMLEDYSRPRPMTSDERQAFLTEYFAASGWGQ